MFCVCFVCVVMISGVQHVIKHTPHTYLHTHTYQYTNSHTQTQQHTITTHKHHNTKTQKHKKTKTHHNNTTDTPQHHRSLVTFASVGYGDIHAWLVLECIWSIIFIIVSVFLLAYVIGSTTLAIIKGDERVGKYRERMHALMAYSKLNDLPSVCVSGGVGG